MFYGFCAQNKKGNGQRLLALFQMMIRVTKDGGRRNNLFIKLASPSVKDILRNACMSGIHCGGNTVV